MCLQLTGREKKEKKKLKENEQYKYLQNEITTREKTYRKTTYASDFCPKEVTEFSIQKQAIF